MPRGFSISKAANDTAKVIYKYFIERIRFNKE
jgi:hypothetical protein